MLATGREVEPRTLHRNTRTGAESLSRIGGSPAGVSSHRFSSTHDTSGPTTTTVTVPTVFR